MHLEYVIVTYETERDVYIDGDSLSAGKTGETLRVETGHHFFDLGKPNDYARVQTMRKIGGRLLDDSAQFQELLRSLSVR